MTALLGFALRWQRVLASALVALAVVAAYRGTFTAPFQFDDVPAVLDNPTIRHLWPLTTVLAPPSDFGTTVNGRPLVNLTLALNYALGGTDVRGYHVVNLLIHLAATLALFGLARRLLRRGSPTAEVADLAAFATALLWSLHPLQTESVTYVVQRAESLAALFTLLTLYCFTRVCECPPTNPKSQRRWSMASVASCLAGVGCKETVVVAPLLVLLLDRTFFAGSFGAAWRQRARVYLGLAGTWLALAWLVLASGARGGTAGFGVGVSPWSYALTQCGAVVHYLRLAFWPSPLVFDYGVRLAEGAGAVWPQAALLLVLVGATLVAMRRWPAAGFAGAWLWVTLAPSSSIVPITTQTMAEHRMYLPLAGIVALVATMACLRFGRFGFAALVALAAILGLATTQRNATYRSALALWQDTVARVPDNARAHNNLGRARLEAGDLPGALACFQESLRLAPDSPETLNNYGYALAQSGQPRGAVASFERSLALRPTNARAHDNLGNALLALDRVPDAIAHFEAALRLRPEMADAHWGLGNALAQSGREADAVARYQQALRLDPLFAEAHCGLAVVLAKTGRTAEAEQHYRQAMRLKPDLAEAHNNLGNLLFHAGKLPEALAHYRDALRLKPDYVEARVNLANALAETEPLANAVREYEAVLRAKPENVDALYGLGNTLARSARMPEAIATYQKVLQLKPDHVPARANLGNAFLAADRIAEAIECYREALRLKPDDASLRENLEQALALQRAGGVRN